MDPLRWARVRELFEEVVEASPAAPRAYLEDRVGQDASLVSEVLALVEGDARPDTPLDHSPASLGGEGGSEGSPPQPLLLPDTDVAPYRLLEPIGRGGMGTVYRAIRDDGVMERTVALKLIHAGLDSGEVLRRFLDEQRILSSLEHPHIARLYDAGRAADGRPFFVMEFVPGRPIDTYCAAHGLDISERVELFLQVCDAVSHAHQGFVIHRDLKPSNILVTEEGTVKLLDFGIAKLVDPDGASHDTKTGFRMMTLEYAAPEQIRGEVLTTACDVYALGVVLYELLTGSRPVEDHDRALARAFAPRGAPALPRPSTRVAGDDSHPTSRDHRSRTLRGDLDEILLKALHLDVRDRYADVGSFASDVRAYLQGRPVSAQAPSVPYRVRKFVRRRRGEVAVAALVLVAVGVSAMVAWGQSLRATAERDMAVAVSSFLEDLFEAGDPRVGVVRDTTRMVDFLAIAEVRVRDQLAARPRVRARLQLILGTVYRNLSRTDRAVPVLRAAVESHAQGDTEPGAEAIEARRLLGLSLAETGELEEGLSELRAALAEQLLLEGPEAEATARLHESIGRAYAEARQNAEAIPWLERALASRRARQPPEPASLASSLNTLGSALAQEGRPSEAVGFLAEAADVLGGAASLPRGVRQSDEGYSRNNLSQVLMNLGRLDEARIEAERAGALLDSAFTGANPAKAGNLERRAALLSMKAAPTARERTLADSLFQASLTMQRSLPRSPGGLMYSWNAYGRALRTWSRSEPGGETLDRAIEAFGRSLSEGRLDFGDDHPLVMSVRADLGKTLVEAGRAEEGLAETGPAWALVQRAVPAGHPM
ncbi:MAG: serine/threonine-protein kinase, partial [Gemmatimonadetes bacterium]|nr:serine/threonine-protein kinase [Gemmatimonadota bacterium]